MSGAFENEKSTHPIHRHLNIEMPTIEEKIASREFICDMLEDRRYERPPVLSSESMKEDGMPDIDAVKKMDSGRTKNIRVKWIFDKLGKDAIQKLDGEMSSIGVNHMVIVCSEALSSQAGETLKDLKQQSKFIEIFEFNKTFFNLTKHALVPRHILCPMETTERLMKEWGCSKSQQFPKIKETDPIARYFGAQKGQVFKIIYPSHTLAGEDVLMYRVVV